MRGFYEDSPHGDRDYTQITAVHSVIRIGDYLASSSLFLARR